MMSKEPQPSRTAEKSRFSIMAVIAIHQRRANAVARVGAMAAGSRIAVREEEKGGRQCLVDSDLNICG